jgi:hypothetical protein
VRCRDQHQTLPQISPLLGQGWSANANVLTPDHYPSSRDVQQSIGPTISGGLDFSLRDLLKKPADRPKEFWRGNDLYDPKQVGFDSFSDESKTIGTHYDTNQKGNGNGGHTYGTDLPEDQKDALVEYLKKL